MRSTVVLVAVILAGGAITAVLVQVSPLSPKGWWTAWVICLALVVAAWVGIDRTGRSLNRQFESAVAEFVDGRRDQLIWDALAIRQYNAVIVALLPVFFLPSRFFIAFSPLIALTA